MLAAGMPTTSPGTGEHAGPTEVAHCATPPDPAALLPHPPAQVPQPLEPPPPPALAVGITATATAADEDIASEKAAPCDARPAIAVQPPQQLAAPAPGGFDGESPSSSSDDDVAKAKPPKKRAGRARYMRFWRSIQTTSDHTPVTKKTPVEVIKAALAVKGRRGGLTALYEDFLQSGENWAESCLMHRISKKRSEQYRGRFAWLTKKQLMDKYADAAVVSDLIARKVRRQSINHTAMNIVTLCDTTQMHGCATKT